MKKLLSLLLCLSLLLALAACGKAPAGDAPQPTAGETVEGYTSQVIAFPDWLDGSYAWETLGDTIYLAGRDGGQWAVAAYDTLAGNWQRYALDTGEAYYPAMDRLSASEDALWALMREGPSPEDFEQRRFRDDYGYYLIHLDIATGASTAARIPFEGDSFDGGGGHFFSGLLALDGERALLTSYEHVWVVDANANILSQPALPFTNDALYFRVDSTPYLWTQEGYVPLDRATLAIGAPVDMGQWCGHSSNAGHFLRDRERVLCRMDPATGELTELFAWMDVAQSWNDVGAGHDALENSRGDFYYSGSSSGLYGDCLVKVSKGYVPVRKPLRLACFGDSGGAMYDYSLVEGAFSHRWTPELMDAVLRFNNTDPEYKIEVVPLIYADEAERSRLLIELATRNDIDLLDTSFLPDNALDAGLLVDLLPLIDEDPELSREDFIPALLALMTRRGGLYEYTSRFTLLTMTTHPDLFPGREDWTVANIEALMAAHPEMDPVWHSLDRELLLTLFAWAATAEFIDPDSGACSFESPAFLHWLRLLRDLPDGGEYSEEPKLLDFCYDLAGAAGFSARYCLKDDYAVAGFPETGCTGSYFLKLGSSPNPWRETRGSNTRLGILAASGKREAAWRFLRLLMLGEETPSIVEGIPVLRDSFERAVDAAVTSDHDERFGIDEFNAEDAAILRYQVYHTDKMANTDEGLVRIIREEANRYFVGQLSAEEAAEHIQSRVSVYMAEQMG